MNMSFLLKTQGSSHLLVVVVIDY